MCRDGADDANTDDECAVLAQTTQTQTTSVPCWRRRSDQTTSAPSRRRRPKPTTPGAVMAPTSFSISHSLSHALSISLGVKTEWCQHVSAGGSARGREGTRGHYALTHTHTRLRHPHKTNSLLHGAHNRPLSCTVAASATQCWEAGLRNKLTGSSDANHCLTDLSANLSDLARCKPFFLRPCGSAWPSAFSPGMLCSVSSETAL